MIDPTTTFGKTLLIFFWGMLSVELLTIIFLFVYLPAATLMVLFGTLTVFMNMTIVAVKNYYDPAVKDI